MQYQQCHWYAQNPLDDVLSPTEASNVNVPFSDDVMYSEPDSKCKSILIFAVTWNRYFYRRCESHLESYIVHILVLSGFSRKKYYSCFPVLLFGLYLF